MSRTLIIVRHGAAEPGRDLDSERRLTAQGELQAAEAGSWIAGRAISGSIIASPYRRAQQTAAEISRKTGLQVLDTVLLTPDSSPVAFLDSIIDVQQSLVVVSHLPFVGRLAALLTEGQVFDQPWSTAECWQLEGDLYAPGCMSVVKTWYPGLSI